MIHKILMISTFIKIEGFQVLGMNIQQVVL